MRIYAYIGASGCGKTTAIVDKFLQCKFQDTTIDKMRVCLTEENVLLVGHYEVDKRCKGCDTLSMAILDDLMAFIKARVEENKYEAIVVDGDRINNNKFFNFLLDYEDKVLVTYIKLPLKTLYERMPDCNRVFVRTTETKSQNVYSRYKDRFNWFVVDLCPKTQAWW